ncbi:MAG TPA: alpha/beta hydrolase [Steroidobacteraceae bacterium]|jgi:acetyl esterase
MAVDPRVKVFLDSPLAMHPPHEQLGAQGLRALVAQYPAPVLAPPIHAVSELTVAGAQGPRRARLYRPSAARDLPLVVYFHGGGFVICTIEMYDDTCRLLANYAGCAVASVDYRLAPETPFPGAIEDCYAALKDLASRGTELGFDGSRLAVAGDSAGGNLAAATALLARDRKGPALRFQGLIYPCLDPECSSPSQAAFAEGYMLSREGMLWFWKQYLRSPADATNPMAVPGRGDLTGLPAASVITAEYDPLRDEGEDYADRLRAAGVDVTGRRYLGMIHGFASMPYLTPLANHALADLGADLHTALTA